MILTYNKIIPEDRYSWYTYDTVNLFDRIKLGVKVFESVNRIKYISSNRKEQSILMGKVKGTSLKPPEFGGKAIIHDKDTIIISIVRKLYELQNISKHKNLEVFDLDEVLKIWKKVGEEVKIKKKYIDIVEEIFEKWKERSYSRGVMHGDIGMQNIIHNGYEVTDFIDFEEVMWGYPILDASEIFLDLHYTWGKDWSDKFLEEYVKVPSQRGSRRPILIPFEEVELMQRTRIILLAAMVRKNCKDKEEVNKVVNDFNSIEGWADWANYENKELDYYLEN
jgi:thiamine kinase-like enzyme